LYAEVYSLVFVFYLLNFNSYFEATRQNDKPEGGQVPQNVQPRNLPPNVPRRVRPNRRRNYPTGFISIF